MVQQITDQFWQAEGRFPVPRQLGYHPPYRLSGVAASLELLVEIAKKAWGLDASIHVFGEEQRLSYETEIQLFRIAQ